MKIITVTTDELVEILREELGKIISISKPESKAKEYLNVSQLSRRMTLSRIPGLVQELYLKKVRLMFG
jgi:hypothetical protein